MDPPALSPAAQMYKNEHLRAWDLWKSGKDEEAYIICRNLLADPFVGKWHQAGFHLLLGYSDDCYVEHAQRARNLYHEMLNSQTPALPSEKGIALFTKYLNTAEEVLEQALKDRDNPQASEASEEDVGVEADGEKDAEAKEGDGDDDADMETIADEENAPFNLNDWEPASDVEEGAAFNPDHWEPASDNEWESASDEEEKPVGDDDRSTKVQTKDPKDSDKVKDA